MQERKYAQERGSTRKREGEEREGTREGESEREQASACESEIARNRVRQRLHAIESSRERERAPSERLHAT